MNAYFLYATFASFSILCNVFSQHLNDRNYLSDSDVDYPDYQALTRPAKPQLSARIAKPRSPAIASASQQSKVSPVPILKQINRHNEDGSYTYGFEGADGSFKIETKLASGEVIGKYGYVDDSGKVRVVDYGANKYGFRPAGEGITVPPITIANETETETSVDDGESGQYIPQAVKSHVKSQSNKRKSQKTPPSHFFKEQRAKSHNPPSYFVQEHEESALPIRSEASQKPFITPADINSLQYLLGSDFRESVPFQFRPNETPQRRPSTHTAKFEETSGEKDEKPRPFPQGLPIPTIFDAGQVSQFQAQPNEFSQPKLPSQFELPVQNSGFKAASKTQTRTKSRPQYLLLTPVEEQQPQPQPNTVRRNSNNGQETRSILDELLKQYSIPNGSPAINDFSFSYNTSN